MSGLKVSTFVIPTDEPESDGTAEWNKTTLVVVELEAAGRVGLGYTYADQATAHFIDEVLRAQVTGADAMDVPAVFDKLARAVRNHGYPGVAAMAIRPVDAALWDTKARLLDLPLVKLLGGARVAGARLRQWWLHLVFPDRCLCGQLAGWVEQGIPRVKMKVGRDPPPPISSPRARGPSGPTRVRAPSCSSMPMVATNESRPLAFAGTFADLGVTWFEEPVTR